MQYNIRDNKRVSCRKYQKKSDQLYFMTTILYNDIIVVSTEIYWIHDNAVISNISYVNNSMYQWDNNRVGHMEYQMKSDFDSYPIFIYYIL